MTFRRCLYDYFIVFSRLFIGILFIFSGISKLLDINTFQNTLRVINILPQFTILVSYSLPIIEIILGTLFGMGIKIKYAGYILIFLITLFCFVMGIQIIKNEIVDCNCFGNIIKSKTDIYPAFRKQICNNIKNS